MMKKLKKYYQTSVDVTTPQLPGGNDTDINDTTEITSNDTISMLLTKNHGVENTRVTYNYTF